MKGPNIGLVKSALSSQSLAFAGDRLDSLSATSDLSTGATNVPVWAPGTTFAVLFYWDPGTTPAFIAALWSAIDISIVSGWIFQWSNVAQAPIGSTNEFYFSSLFGTGAESIPFGTPVLGLNCAVVTLIPGTPNVARASFNGGPVVTLNLTHTPLAPGAGATHSLGGGYTGAHGFDPGGLLHAIRLNRSSSDLELTTWSSTSLPPTPQSRYHFPPSLTGDPAVTFDWLASRDWNGIAPTSTSAGSSPVTFNVVGAPSLPAMSEEYRTDLQSMFTDNFATQVLPAPVGSGNYFQPNCYARLRTLQPASQPQIGIGYINTDPNSGTTGNSEFVPGYQAGVWQADVPPTQVSGLPIQLKWLQRAAYNVVPPSGEVDVWSPATEDITAIGGAAKGGYIAGLVLAQGSTFIQTTPQKRMVCYGDSLTLAYFANGSNGSWLARTRAAFPTAGGPGGITVDAYGGRRFYNDVGVGAPTGVGDPALTDSFANKINSELTAVATTTQILVDWIGFNDSQHASVTWSASSFGAAKRAYLQALLAKNPNVQIFALNLPQTSLLNVPAWNTATAAACSGLSRVTLVDTTGWGLTYVDGIHPDAASQITIFNNLKTIIGY